MRSIAPRWERLYSQTPAVQAGGGGVVVGVDRVNRVIRGYVVAQLGPFRTAGRGEFDDYSLMQIVRLMNAQPGGVKSRFAHPGPYHDGIGSFLGRAKAARLADGGRRVRADLHLARSASISPLGDLAAYVMALAEEDPAALGSSLVLQSAKERRLDAAGRPLLDAEGHEAAPLWRPTAICASDLVDEAEAVRDGLLGPGEFGETASRRPGGRPPPSASALRLRLARLERRF